MKRILHLLVLLIIALCFIPAAYAESPVDRPVNTSSLDDVFAKHGVNGTLVIYDVQKNGYWLHNAGRAAERFYPASTFKIFNSLIGLSEALLKMRTKFFTATAANRCTLKAGRRTPVCAAPSKYRSCLLINNWRAKLAWNGCRQTLKSCTTAMKLLAIK